MKKNSNKHIKQTKTAILLGVFLFSIQLQKGRKSVAKIPPIHNGIRKSLAMYNPKIIRNNNAVFCKNEEELGIII
jgi:hypothetical protein